MRVRGRVSEVPCRFLRPVQRVGRASRGVFGWLDVGIVCCVLGSFLNRLKACSPEDQTGWGWTEGVFALGGEVW